MESIMKTLKKCDNYCLKTSKIQDIKELTKKCILIFYFRRVTFWPVPVKYEKGIFFVFDQMNNKCVPS